MPWPKKFAKPSSAGLTLSEKNAMKEYKLEPSDFVGLKGQFRSCYGSTYMLYDRSDVEEIARKKHGSASFRLTQIDTEIADLKKQIKPLEDRLKSLEAERAGLAPTGGATPVGSPTPAVGAKQTARKRPLEQFPSKAARKAVEGAYTVRPHSKAARKSMALDDDSDYSASEDS
eukprot:TRINITY_DN24975_c0_g1_i1.p2 TRINITY_DN24975_c0_g1~~TRINITY_DN24975_c0_g1_i1.p2  ORF type:complete len:186 (+),score=16.96 TRINITY_DN24975_c0_g1_i1:41-559(+)